jgi:hypothetical protein
MDFCFSGDRSFAQYGSITGIHYDKRYYHYRSLAQDLLESVEGNETMEWLNSRVFGGINLTLPGKAQETRAGFADLTAELKARRLEAVATAAAAAATTIT